MREVIIRQASTPSELYVPVSPVNYITVPDERFTSQSVKLLVSPKFTSFSNSRRLVFFFYVNQIS